MVRLFLFEPLGEVLRPEEVLKEPVVLVLELEAFVTKEQDEGEEGRPSQTEYSWPARQ